MEKIIYIIIPCYNEEKRLSISSFLNFSIANPNVRFIFANDGSSDNTKDVIQQLSNSNPDQFIIFNYPANIGKGMIIREAFLSCKENMSKAEWVGYWDADLSSPLSEIFSMINYAELTNVKFDSIWGSRIVKLGSQVYVSSFRNVFSRSFSLVIGLLFKVKVYDSQSGAKLFRYPLAIEIFKDKFISKWLFDLELLLRTDSSKIIEYPLMNSVHKPGSKFKIHLEIIRTLKDLIKLKIKYYS